MGVYGWDNDRLRGREGRRVRAKERAGWTPEQRAASVRRRLAAGYNLQLDERLAVSDV